MNVTHMVLAAAIIFTSLVHLAHEGYRQRRCRFEIHRLRQEISAVRQRLAVEQAELQKTLFAIYRNGRGDRSRVQPLLAGIQKTTSQETTP